MHVVVPQLIIYNKIVDITNFYSKYLSVRQQITHYTHSNSNLRMYVHSLAIPQP